MRGPAADLPADPAPGRVDAWVELAEMIQDPEFRAHVRAVAEFGAADGGARAGTSMWFAGRVVELAGRARERGIDPESPEAEEVLRDLLGDIGRTAVLDASRRPSATGSPATASCWPSYAVPGPCPGTARSSPGWSPHCARGRAANLTCVSRTT